MSRAARLAMLVFAMLAALVAASWRELPHWRPGGVEAIPDTSLSSGTQRLSCPASGTRIAIFGDSHVAGTSREGTVAAFGSVMQGALPAGVTVDLKGMGGDTAEMGERRWLTAGPTADDLVMLAYGTNDAAPRGWLRAKQPVPLEQFEAALTRQIRHWQARDAQVVVVAAPPPGSEAMAERIAPYRKAAAGVAAAQGVAILDPAEAFAQCDASAPLLGYDALHMSAAGHHCLGTWLAAQLCPEGL